jgi:acyl transferase domain-containing protein/acyl carrier protein
MVEHGSIVNLLFSLQKRYPLTPLDTYLFKTSYLFDVSVTELFGWFLKGGRLAILEPGDHKDPEKILETIEKQKVTHINFVPSMFNVFTRAIHPGNTGKLSGLKYIFLAGEALLPGAVEGFQDLDTGVLLENIYGPTEAAVYSSWYSLHDWKGQGPIPIGKPLPNVTLYIYGQWSNLQPIGVPGELCIGGEGVARGYMNRPGLTNDKFKIINDKLKIKKGKGALRANFDTCTEKTLTTNTNKIYKTGDLARWLEDGNIEFLGRMDFQVKIRGFRVELGEIQGQLLNHNQIKEAVVAVKQDRHNERYLCGYYVSERELPAEELRAHLSRQLPDYIIPAFFVRLEQLPLTRSGKVDGTALPEPTRDQLQLETAFLAPQNHLEKRIAGVWKKILKINKIGVNDNFFDIGGNSLSIIRLSSRLKEVFQQEIPVVTLFNYPTVRAQAGYFGKIADDSSLRKGVGAGGNIMETAAPVRISRGEIAIVGMAGRFPGAANVDEFWNSLKKGVEAISFFSDEELEAWGVDAELIGNPNYVKAKGVLRDADKFDAFFFDYSAREARLMDPQMRVLHECIWEALEDAGYVPGSYIGSIGLYVGAMSNSWRMQGLSGQMGSHSDLLAVGSLNDRDFLATRISYKLDLQGPVVTVQTACSTSLVAVDAACQALLLGKCHMALAGGISLTVRDRTGYLYEEGMVRSPDGHCCPFDAGAKGTTGGNGVGIVVLKPLAAAESGGDYIRAVIKGSAVNNDGAGKVGYAAPSVEGQVKVIRAAQQAAGIEPESVTYLETHGTGTALGDPVEIEALKKAFDTDKKGFCPIGAVKANVGHLDAAAGVTGLIKTVLALEHRMIPPSVNFETPNPRIDFANSPFYVNNRLKEWKNGNYPLRAGVSSFGIGGTNVHIILEEAPEIVIRPTTQTERREYKLILLSAKTPSALDKMTVNLAGYLKKNPRVDLSNTAYTLQVGRKAFKYRRMLVGSTVHQVSTALSSPGSTRLRTSRLEKETPPVVFMFPGLGSQYVNMGLELYQKEPFFREETDRCFEILKPLMEYDIKEIIYPGNALRETQGRESVESPDINRFEIAQLVVFILEYALAKLLIEWGIHPDGMIGYSFGEYSAACLSGVFSLEDALNLVVYRGRLIRELSGGTMMSVPQTVKEVERLLAADNDNQLSIAIDNGSSCVVSGPEAAISQFEERMRKKRCLCMRLPTSHAIHSRMMEPVVEEFKAVVSRTSLNKPQIPYISNVTGTWLTDREATNPGYWAGHLRKTVRFADGLKELMSEPDTLFIEVGPGHELSSLLVRHLGKDNGSLQPVINLVKHPERQVSDVHFLLNKLGILWLKGIPIDWSGFYRKEKRRRMPLPTYPFEGQLYSSQYDFNKPGDENISKQAAKRKKPDIADWFYLPQWERSHLLPLPEQSFKSPEQSCWLVFTENSGFCGKLVRRFGHVKETLISVLKGRGFRKIDPQTYEINPQQSSHYDRLMEKIQRSGQRPVIILHLWNIPGGHTPELDRKAVDDVLDLGSVSLLYLARAIARQGFTGDTRIDILTATVYEVIGQEPLSPQKAPILGMAKVIPQEYNSITCRCIDIVLPVPGSAAEKKLIRQLLDEFHTNSAEVVIAYRANYRWIQVYKPLRLLEFNHKPARRLRRGGVYLITGGLGNIGFTLSKYLAENLEAKLVLTGRTMLPDREEWEKYAALHENNEEDKAAAKIRKIRILEESGAEVAYFNCDTADPDSMQKIVTDAGERFGQINGVIHAAVPQNLVKPAADMDITEIKRQFQAKVYGVLVLAKIFQDKELDFGIFISSPSSILGGLGYGAYAAANAFPDAFIYRFNRVNTTPWLTVNWGDWSFAAESGDKNTMLYNPLGYLLMTPEQGLETFKRILEYYPLNQVVVSAGDLQERINQWVRLEFKQEQEKEPRGPKEEKSTSSTLPPHQTRPDLMTPYLAPTNHMEEILSDIWQNYFGLDQVGIEDNFFELGATSLDIIQLNRKVKEVIGKDIPVSALFRYPNISALALHLGQQEIDMNQPAPVKEASRSQKMQKARRNLQKKAKILKV